MGSRFDAARWAEGAALFSRRALARRSIVQHLHRSASSAQLSKCLNVFDLTFLGLGSIIGAGIFVLSGVAAHSLAGPAVVLSYLVAALAALLSALSYAEFVVDLPVAGGAYNYVFTVFGELAAWSVAWNMILEITLSSAAVARGFTSYLATLLGWEPSMLRLSAGPLEVDAPAALLVLALTALLSAGTKQSSLFNIVVSGTNILAILFVVGAGFPQADASNLQPFAPYGARGVASAASVVFFSYIGFDYIANAAEEAKEPTRDLPISIVASLALATLLYFLMSLAIVLMQPYTQIDVNAPFASAFIAHGMAWAAKVVSFGALTGIVTSTLTGLLSQARLFVVLGREALLPPRLAAVSERTGTPLLATLTTGAAAATLAMLLDIGILAEMVSIGTLYVFFAVCAGVVCRRYQEGLVPAPRSALAALAGIVASALGSSLSFTLRGPWELTASLLAAWLLCTLALYRIPQAYTPTKFQAPLFPWTPSLGMLFTLYLICSLGWPAYARFGAWMVAGLAVYALYGMHAAERKDQAAQEISRAHFESQVGGSDGEMELPELHSLHPEGPLDSPSGDVPRLGVLVGPPGVDPYSPASPSGGEPYSPMSPEHDPYSPTGDRRPLRGGMPSSYEYDGRT